MSQATVTANASVAQPLAGSLFSVKKCDIENKSNSVVYLYSADTDTAPSVAAVVADGKPLSPDETYDLGEDAVPGWWFVATASGTADISVTITPKL